MTGINIVKNVNVLADDSIDFDEVLFFINKAISEINLRVPALFPEITNENTEEEYYVMKEITFEDEDAPTDEEKKRKKQFDAANAMFINTLIIQGAHYLMKVQDASPTEWSASQKVFEDNILTFMSRFKSMCDESWLTTGVDVEGDGFFSETEFGTVYVESNSPYNEANTWGTQPTSGNGAVGYSQYSSKKPYGK